MLADLFKEVEAPALTRAFYLASDTDWLLRQICGLRPVQALHGIVANDSDSLAELAGRCIKLFDARTEPGLLSDYEPAICCYAYVLAQLDQPVARAALDYLDARSGPIYGWLDRLMSRYLRNESTMSFQEREPVSYGPWANLIDATSTSTTSEHRPHLVSLSDFDFVSETSRDITVDVR